MTQYTFGASSVTAKANVLYVDGAYTGAQNNGSFSAPYATITAALAAAAAGDTIMVLPGAYTEDLTLVDQVDLKGQSGPRELSPTVTGTATATDLSCSIENMAFTDDGAGNAFYFTGTAADTLQFENCDFLGTATGGPALECDNTAGAIVLNNCTLGMTTGNAAEVIRMESGTLNMFDCVCNHTDNTSESLVAEGDAATTINIQSCSFQGTVGSEAAVTNPVISIKSSAIIVGAVSCLQVAAGNTVDLFDCEFTSSDAANDAIDGAGTVTVSDLRFLSTADEIATTVTVTHHGGSRTQHGTVAAAGASPQVDAVTLPQVFPSTAYDIQLTFEATGGGADDVICSVDEGTIATTGFSVVTTSAAAAAISGNIHWHVEHD